jgi:hypothetical protein
MFAALRHSDSTAARLGRVLAGWLVVILLVQGSTALRAMVNGPAHRHLATAQATPDAAHERAHAQGMSHHHDAATVLLPADGEVALDTAACVLMAALAPMAMSFAWPGQLAPLVHAAAAPWALLERDSAPPRRPPRA